VTDHPLHIQLTAQPKTIEGLREGEINGGLRTRTEVFEPNVTIQNREEEHSIFHQPEKLHIILPTLRREGPQARAYN
jgi:hypothetical protein